MTHRRTVFKFIFGFVSFLSLKGVHLNTDEVFDNIHYNTRNVSWIQAVQQCGDSATTLVNLSADPDDNHHNVSVIKRSVHMHFGDESWVGVYSTYEVMNGQDTKPDMHVQLCVAMHVTLVQVLPNNSVFYKYNLVTKNCTTDLFAMCTGNNSIITATRSSKNWFEAQRICTLLTPEYSALPVAQQSTFATGNSTTPQSGDSLFNKTFWVNLVVQETPSKLSERKLSGNILRCGYIGYLLPGVYYSDCYQNKAFICQDKSKSSPTPESSVGLYVGISVILVVVLTSCVVAGIYIRKKRQLPCGGSSEVLPRGGKSFTRRNNDATSDERGQVNTGYKEENRITTYNQINLDLTKPTSPSVGIIDSVLHHEYSRVYKKNKDENKPDVVPRNTKKESEELVRSGYLSMDGTMSHPCAEGVDKDYDLLESTRSTNSTRYRQIDLDGTGNNIYSSTTSDLNESAYDVTFNRGSSKRRLMDEVYDHVMTDTESGTMNRKICDSVGETPHHVNMQMTKPRSNPGYDDVIIIK